MQKVTTNNVPRPIIYGFELTESEAKEFDYAGEYGSDELSNEAFFRYQGSVYHLGDAMAVEPTNSLCKGWTGYYGESFFSAVVFRYTDDYESVVVGRATC